MQTQMMRLITTTLGLQLRPQDEATIAHKLNARSQTLGLPSLSAYYTLLTASDSSRQQQEWRWLIESLTTTESYFFRDKGQFSLLRHQVLPDLIAQKRQQVAASITTRPSLRVWSAGCSSGEEAYSLAILLRELIPDFARWDLTILGTDINPAMLEQARSGIYSNWSFRSLDPSIQQRYFHAHRDSWRIRPDIAAMVTFQSSNLVQDRYPDPIRLLDQVDLIICRNVFIYFQPEAIAQVLQKFYTTLAPRGYLLAGHTELQGINLGNFQIRSFTESVIYQRPGEVALQPSHTSGLLCMEYSGQPRPSSPTMPLPPVPLASTSPTAPASTSLSSLEVIRPLLLEKAYAQAIQQLQQIVRNEPQNGAAYHWLAQVYANSGQHELAIAACQQAMQCDPLAVDPCYLLAQIREEQGDVEAAKILYKRIIYAAPEFISAYLELGSLYAREGNRKKAMSIWQSALTLVQRSPHLATSTPFHTNHMDLETDLKMKLGL
ncbi:CheR family methyltransferase [Leptolyngbya sp. FACHB-16]|nr:CheR family methyltransferase [Leptolyngbya sp. FACHB-16]MBD1911458.1 tetratricopeptide repeat protein [Leptolyngbya sp. FACHB-8]